MPSDEKILYGLKTSDSTSYEWLVVQFEGPLFRFFVCDHRDFHLAQEQTSETFLQLVRALPSMNGGIEQLRSFVFAIAKNVKQRNWRRPRTGQQPLDDANEISDPRPSPAALADHREELDRVLTAISQFEPAVRDVLLFRFVEGYSLDEVAEIVDLPLGTVKSHIHRGVARLKKTLSESGCKNE